MRVGVQQLLLDMKNHTVDATAPPLPATALKKKLRVYLCGTSGRPLSGRPAANSTCEDSLLLWMFGLKVQMAS